jgi:hypothetical protein
LLWQLLRRESKKIMELITKGNKFHNFHKMKKLKSFKVSLESLIYSIPDTPLTSGYTAIN